MEPNSKPLTAQNVVPLTPRPRQIDMKALTLWLGEKDYTIFELRQENAALRAEIASLRETNQSAGVDTPVK